jgi:hypothetical protein
MLSNLIFLVLYFLVFTFFLLTIIYVILTYFSLRGTTEVKTGGGDSETETETGVEATETVLYAECSLAE